MTGLPDLLSSPKAGVMRDLEAGRSLLNSKRRPRGLSNRELPRGCLMRVTLVAVMLAALLFGWSTLSALRNGSGSQAADLSSSHVTGWRSLLGLSPNQRPDTLVVYIYSKTDPEYERNLHFFVRQAIRANDGCEYVIVVQQGDGVEESDPLPQLPPNGRYEFHENKCFDWGTIGWLLQSGRVQPKKYKWFMFMNSSTRGPFLPAYWPKGRHWTRAFIDRITKEVKLVGSTISCEATLLDGDPKTGQRRQTPHVQSYAMATDQVGLEVLEADGRVFECHNTIHNTIWHSELGSSVAMLNAGYNLDSLMLRYQGVDWRDEAYWQCNAGENPYKEGSLDGVNLQPLEVMFVKVKGFLLDLRWSSATAAQAMDRWTVYQGNKEAITGNTYLLELPEIKKERALSMALKGAECFDVQYYKQRNGDFPPMADAQLWTHFVLYGQFEGRPFRFSCGPPRRHAAAGPAMAPPVTHAQASETSPKELVKVALKAAQSFQVMVGEPGGLLKALAGMEEQKVGARSSDHHSKTATKHRTQKGDSGASSSGEKGAPPGKQHSITSNDSKQLTAEAAAAAVRRRSDAAKSVQQQSARGVTESGTSAVTDIGGDGDELSADVGELELGSGAWIGDSDEFEDIPEVFDRMLSETTAVEQEADNMSAAADPNRSLPKSGSGTVAANAKQPAKIRRHSAAAASVADPKFDPATRLFGSAPASGEGDSGSSTVTIA